VDAEAEPFVLSPAEIAFRHHGLEFARARLTQEPGLPQSSPEIVFGIGAAECRLGRRQYCVLPAIDCEVRRADEPRDNPQWRLHPERRLESLMVKDIATVDQRLQQTAR
jgi:hypothetical protein